MSKIISLREYQDRVLDYARGIAQKSLWFNALGLGGEAGEALEKIKRIYRDDDGKITPERQKAAGKELGDVLWQLSMCATQLGLDLGEIASDNLEKVKLREENGKIFGEGDEREKNPTPPPEDPRNPEDVALFHELMDSEED